MSLQFPDRGPYSAGGSIQPHLRVLRAVGFCHLAPLSHPVIPGAPPVPVPLWYRLHSAYHVFAQCVTILFVLQQLVYAYQVSWHGQPLQKFFSTTNPHRLENLCLGPVHLEAPFCIAGDRRYGQAVERAVRVTVSYNMHRQTARVPSGYSARRWTHRRSWWCVTSPKSAAGDWSRSTVGIVCVCWRAAVQPKGRGIVRSSAGGLKARGAAAVLVLDVFGVDVPAVVILRGSVPPARLARWAALLDRLLLRPPSRVKIALFIISIKTIGSWSICYTLSVVLKWIRVADSRWCCCTLSTQRTWWRLVKLQWTSSSWLSSTSARRSSQSCGEFRELI